MNKKLLNITAIVLTAVTCIIASAVYAQAPIVDYSVPESQVNANNTTNNANTKSQAVPAPTANTTTKQPQLPPTPITSNMTIPQRVTRLEQQVNNLIQTNYQTRIETLQQQIQNLNGKIDSQAHEIAILQQQLKDYYKDLDARLNNTKNHEEQVTKSLTTAASVQHKTANHSSKKVTAKHKSKPTLSANKHNNSHQKNTAINSKANILKEQKKYQSAFSELQKQKYNIGSQKLQNYLKTYPDGIYAANSHYWLGEIYFLQKNHKKAINEFSIVVHKYSSSTKVPEALLKLALLHESTGKRNLAQNELNMLKKKYPHSEATKIAKQQLLQ